MFSFNFGTKPQSCLLNQLHHKENKYSSFIKLYNFKFFHLHQKVILT